VFPVAPAFRCRECHSIRPCTVVSLPLTEACRRFFAAQASSYRRSPDGIEARLAVDSIPVVAACPPLRVAGVAIESVTVRAPLCSAGVTPRPRSYGGIRLPMRRWASSRCAGCTALPLTGGAHRISRVPGPALLTCHGLRPRWARGSLGPALLGCGLPCCSAGRHPQLSVHHGAQSLHASALRPVSSLCTLHDRRDLRPRNTRYPVPGQGFRSRDLPPADRAELGSAH
jgi:hypothetical protein